MTNARRVTVSSAGLRCGLMAVTSCLLGAPPLAAGAPTVPRLDSSLRRVEASASCEGCVEEFATEKFGAWHGNASAHDEVAACWVEHVSLVSSNAIGGFFGFHGHGGYCCGFWTCANELCATFTIEAATDYAAVGALSVEAFGSNFDVITGEVSIRLETDDAVVFASLGSFDGDGGDSVVLNSSGRLAPGQYTFVIAMDGHGNASRLAHGEATVLGSVLLRLGAPPTGCHAADLNVDEFVNGVDLGTVLALWGEPGGLADLDGSGEVDGGDLGVLLAAWGPCLDRRAP